MSHFTVAVFTDGTKTIEELLAPFNENMEVASSIYETKAEIIEKARKRKANFEERKAKGEELDDWMQEYLIAETDEQLYQCEYDEDDTYDTDGNLLSTYNPDSKWDWYSIGGRWQGLLKAKSGEVGEKFFLDITPYKKDRFDSAKISDIVFSPDKKQYEKSLRWWEVVVEDSPLKDGEDKSDFFNFYKKDYLINRYKNKETYATSQSLFSTFAVITPDGKWYEKGKMGWWACVSNEEDEWSLKYKERFIDTANPDWILTIVDCHI